MSKHTKKLRISSNHLLAFCFLLVLGIFGIRGFYNIVTTEINANSDISTAVDQLEKNYNDNFYLKYGFLNVNGVAHKLMGQQLMKSVVKLNNGHLTQAVRRTNVAPLAENLIKFKDYLDEKNIPLLYVQAPHKISKYNPELPEGVVNFSNRNADDLLKMLTEAGINTIDLRSEFLNENLDHYSLFYKTDIHWTFEGSFWGFKNIMEYMHNQFDFPSADKYIDLNNYNNDVYKDWALGYLGKITGSKYAGVDDISLITPKFETNLSLSIPSHGVVRTGGFSDAIFNMERIEFRDYYNKAPYEIYIGGQYPLTIINNKMQSNNKKVLIVLDSFGRPVGSFMSLCFTETEIIDLRKFNDESLTSYIDKSKPDVVMFLYNPASLNRTFFKF